MFTGIGWTVFLWTLGTLLALFVIAAIRSSVRYIPNKSVGILEKLVSGHGSVRSGFIALAGEAGYQPRILRGGWHVLRPFQYRIHRMALVTIPQGKVGYVFARDGAPLAQEQTLASNASALDFQDAAGFLREGGQRGLQRMLLREGTHAINLAQFLVIAEDGVYGLALDHDEEHLIFRMADLIAKREGFRPVVITDDLVGIVTVMDGPALEPGAIIAPLVGNHAGDPETDHNNFQNPEKFLLAGGRRGRQLQVLVEGTYYINRLFATVETIPKTVIEVGTVGVVVSYTGSAGSDVSGDEYKHGELVHEGSRGVWSTALLPGKYAFNTYAGKVVVVPTTNIILKWIRNQAGAHRLDENLAEVSLITKDAFEPSLPLSVVVHIDYRKAPLVVQRFGDIKRLVEQTLDPMVSAYFKNVAQTRTLIELLQQRSEIQLHSAEEMQGKFKRYNLDLQEVLIGTPTSGKGDVQIEQILAQLRSRQIATEQVETYGRQQEAAVKERELREAEARAKQQTHITEAELSIQVQANQGKAEYARAQQQAAQIQTLAQAESEKIRLLGEGEAGKIAALAGAEAERAARVGIAQAMAIEEQVRAYGGPRFQLTQQVMQRFAEAIETARVDVVPKILIGGGSATGGAGDGLGGGNLVQALLAMLLSDKIADGGVTASAPSAAAQTYRDQIQARLSSRAA
jgi:uncharacterized membrane protein YqiK